MRWTAWKAAEGFARNAHLARRLDTGPGRPPNPITLLEAGGSRLAASRFVRMHRLPFGAMVCVTRRLRSGRRVVRLYRHALPLVRIRRALQGGAYVPLELVGSSGGGP